MILFIILMVQAHTDYYMDLRTGPLTDAGSDSIGLYTTLVGKTIALRFPTELDHPPRDDFERFNIDNFTLHAEVDIGEVECVILTVTRSDMWLVDWVAVSSWTYPEKRFMYNTESMSLSSDALEGSSELELCVQGEETFVIVTKTGDGEDENSSYINLKATIIGTDGETSTGFLDNPDFDDFEHGEYDGFMVENMANVGAILCIHFTVMGDDAWTFDGVVVYSTTYTASKYFSNENGVVMSSDLTEGVSELVLC